MPDQRVFATPGGLAFYDPKEYLDARVLPGTDIATACKFSASCTRDDCRSAHPFVCQYGVQCRVKERGCKFFHPSDDSAEPVSSNRKLCKYGVACTTPKCFFAHPKGRLTVPRVRARVFATHSHTLEELATPVPLLFDLQDTATVFQMQGEFLCGFQPYPGTWAKLHFKAVSVYRFNATLNTYHLVGNYSLDGHYCNSAAAAGRYMVFSFWPYEEEAMRTIWGCLKITRSLEKELKAKDKTYREMLEAKDEELKELEMALDQAQVQANAAWRETRKARLEVKAARKETSAARHDAATARQDASNARQDASFARQDASNARQDASSARQEAAITRREKMESDNRWREMQQQQERERNERLRNRDPIHIYALQECKSGFQAEDWRLVLDYHKGAHDIQLGEARSDGTQQVNFVVHSDVLQFDLVVPRDITSIKIKLPLSPPVLCPDF